MRLALVRVNLYWQALSQSYCSYYDHIVPDPFEKVLKWLSSQGWHPYGSSYYLPDGWRSLPQHNLIRITHLENAYFESLRSSSR